MNSITDDTTSINGARYGAIAFPFLQHNKLVNDITCSVLMDNLYPLVHGSRIIEVTAYRMISPIKVY